MSKKFDKPKIYSQQIFELRYKPYIDMIDCRGHIASLLCDKLGMSRWNVGTNRVDITSDDKREKCFVSFKNLGYVLIKPDSPNHFQDKATKFLKIMNSDFDKKFRLNLVMRLGVRSTYLISYGESFENLLGNFKRKYINYPDEHLKFFKAKLIDASAPFDFKAENGFFSTLCGPIKKDQYPRYFDELIIEELPDIGLFFDIDYFKTDIGETSWHEIIKLLNEYASASSEICNEISNLILA